jgi:rubrerythrin
MDQREIESILYDLNTKKNDLLLEFQEIYELLNDERKTTEELEELAKEKEDIEYDIREIELDIAMYEEMMDKLFSTEIGECGFPCDGRCQQCGGTENYDPMYEVFAGGDY